MALNDQIQAYLALANISFTAGDYQTGQPEGQEDQILHWDTKLGVQPTKIQLANAQSVKEATATTIAYKTKRANEYPSMADYLDGIVKGDAAQVQTYIDACLAVKAKYPKP